MIVSALYPIWLSRRHTPSGLDDIVAFADPAGFDCGAGPQVFGVYILQIAIPFLAPAVMTLFMQFQRLTSIPSNVFAAHEMVISAINLSSVVPMAIKFNSIYKGFVFLHLQSPTDAEQLIDFFHDCVPLSKTFRLRWADRPTPITTAQGWLPWDLLTTPLHPFAYYLTVPTSMPPLNVLSPAVPKPKYGVSNVVSPYVSKTLSPSAATAPTVVAISAVTAVDNISASNASSITSSIGSTSTGHSCDLPAPMSPGSMVTSMSTGSIVIHNSCMGDGNEYDCIG